MEENFRVTPQGTVKIPWGCLSTNMGKFQSTPGSQIAPAHSLSPSPKVKNCSQSLEEALPTIPKSLWNLETTIPPIYLKFSFLMTSARP